MRTSPPSKDKIVRYWGINSNELEANECRMGADESEWGERCWCCGLKEDLERCHIIPNSLSGNNEPSNFVLLCAYCHLEAPNVNDKYEMWEWIAENRNTFYFDDEEIEFIRNEIKDKLSDTVKHWGEKGLNNSTRLWVQREVTKSFKDKFLSYEN